MSGCGGGGGGGSTPTPPSGNPNPNPPALSRLTLTGTVTDAPISNAIVTATVGGETFTANADANGNYSLEIAIAQSATSGFVTLSAKGVGAQSYVEFSSLLGTLSALLTQAGSDATLSNTENFGTQITNVSTALAVLLKEANGGQALTTDALVASLSASLDSQELLNLATAIKLLVDQPTDYPLPAGQTSLRALLADSDLRQQLVAAAYQQDPPNFSATQNEMVSDSTLIEPVTPAAVPANLIATTLPSDIAEAYMGLDRTVAYNFNANGTGTATNRFFHRNMTWTVSGDAIEIVYATPVLSMVGYERGTCPSPEFGYGPHDLYMEYNVSGATLRWLSERILTITESRQIVYRDCGPSSGTEVVTVARTIVDPSNTRTIDAAQLRNTARTLWIWDGSSDYQDVESGSTPVMPDTADLRADGTGSTRIFAKLFTWALDASGKVLTLNFTDGSVGKFYSLRQVDAVSTDMVYDLALSSGRRSVGAAVSIHADPQRSFTYTANNAVGRHYWMGLGEYGAPAEVKGFRYRFDTDGTGSREDEILDINGNAVVRDVNYSRRWGLFWHIDDGMLVSERTRMPVTGTYNCLRPDPQCFVDEERRRIPLVSVGNRTYSLEFWRYRIDSQGDFLRRQTYLGIYDYEALAP